MSNSCHVRLLLDRIAVGFAAGAAGGIVGAAIKLLGELIFPPRFLGEPIPPAVAISRLLHWLTGAPLLQEHVTLAVQSFHWSFSVFVGAIYGIIVEFFPAAKFGYGVAFGFVVLLSTHETLLPYFGFSLPWTQIPLKEHLSELFTHALFGVAVEGTRRFVRGRLFPSAVVMGGLGTQSES